MSISLRKLSKSRQLLSIKKILTTSPARPTVVGGRLLSTTSQPPFNILGVQQIAVGEELWGYQRR